MTILRVPAKPVAVVMVCGKCARRHGHPDRLSKPLKRALKPAKIKVVKTRCLGVCPGKATAMHDSRHPQEWLIVQHGTPVEDVVATLTGPSPGTLFVEAVG